MTELGRTARWGTAALVAPLAAAALSAATSWGAAHPPAASGKNSSTDQSADTAVSADGAGAAGPETAALDKSRLVLLQQATAEQAAVIRLEKILNRLNARTRALARAPIPGLIAGASTGGITPVASSTGGQPAVAGPPVVAAAPAPAAPAPTTHGSTGAS